MWPEHSCLSLVATCMRCSAQPPAMACHVIFPLWSTKLSCALQATLEHILLETQALTFFITHYPQVCSFAVCARLPH